MTIYARWHEKVNPGFSDSKSVGMEGIVIGCFRDKGCTFLVIAVKNGMPRTVEAAAVTTDWSSK